MRAPVVAVLDYGIGNLRSAEKALARGGRRPLTDDRDVIASADGVVLPGVGAFGDAWMPSIAPDCPPSRGMR